jgi:hypothetical protein
VGSRQQTCVNPKVKELVLSVFSIYIFDCFVSLLIAYLKS